MNEIAQEWKERVLQAQNIRKQFTEDWERNYKAVFGDAWLGDGLPKTALGLKTASDAETPQRKYYFDLLLAFLKTVIPGLLLNQPEIIITATKSGEQTNSNATADTAILQNRINSILSDLDGFDAELRAILVDAHAAYGILETIPIYRIQPHPQAGEPVRSKDGTPLFDPTTRQPLMWPEEQISEPSYDLCRVSPFRFLVDPQATNNLRRAGWCGKEITHTLESLKREAIYSPEVIERIEEKARDRSKKDQKDWEITVELVEIFDQNTSRVIVLSPDYEEILRDEEIPQGIESHTFSFLKFTEIPGQWFPKAEISSGRGHQDEYREGREWQRKYARKSNPQIGVRRPFHDAFPTESDKIGDGKSDIIVVTSEVDVFPLDKERTHASPSIEAHMAAAMHDFDQTMGQPSQSRGLVGEAKFATEAEIAAAQGDIRHQDKERAVKKFLSSAVEKLIFLIAVNDGESDEVRTAIERLRPDLNIEITIENKTAHVKAIERKQLIEAMQAVPLLQGSLSFIKQLLQTFDMRDTEQILKELGTTQADESQNEPPKVSISLALKHELLPEAARDAVSNLIGIPLGLEPDQGTPTAQGPDLGATPAEGTGPMAPGSRMQGQGMAMRSPGAGMMGVRT